MMYTENSIQDCHENYNIQQGDCFHHQIGLKFKE